jgi:hypothetical protein
MRIPSSSPGRQKALGGGPEHVARGQSEASAPGDGEEIFSSPRRGRQQIRQSMSLLPPLRGLETKMGFLTRGRRSFVALTPGYMLEPLRGSTFATTGHVSTANSGTLRRRLPGSGGKAPERRPERCLSARQLPAPFAVRPGLSPLRDHGLNRWFRRTGDSTGRCSRCASRGGSGETWPR